jgi:lipoyl(octanoyl) transferase
MAVDDAIVEEVGLGHSPPTLRLYSWEPPCLSLGFTQPAEQADRDRLCTAGWGLVRRPTGGRAILHTDELTYSLSAPLQHPLMLGGVLASYQRISQAIIRGLELLNIPIKVNEIVKPERHADQAPVCFEVPSAYEITAMGKKLVGSAQVRRKNSVLQHGAIPLTGDISRICLGLAFPSEEDRDTARQRVKQRAATIQDLTGQEPPAREVGEAVCQGFSEVFHISFQPADLTHREEHLAAELDRDRYTSTGWTDRV